MKRVLKIVIIIAICVAALLIALAVVKHTGSRITPFEAADIAMRNAGLTEEQVIEKDVELEDGMFSLYYEVELEDMDTEYNYSIDAKTGEILSFCSKPRD